MHTLAFNLFIYLSLAAIMVFIPSLSLCLSLSGDGGLVSACRLIIKPEFSHQTLNQTNYTRDRERGQVDVGER